MQLIWKNNIDFYFCRLLISSNIPWEIVEKMIIINAIFWIDLPSEKQSDSTYAYKKIHEFSYSVQQVHRLKAQKV